MEPVSVIEGHIDTVLTSKIRFYHKVESTPANMRAGNVQAAFYSLCPVNKPMLVKRFTKFWFSYVRSPRHGLMQVRSIDDFDRARKQGKIGAILHYEGAGGIDEGFTLLEEGARQGLRGLCITWADTNKFGHGAKFKGEQSTDGLTELGKELVARAEGLGITIDVSHLNDPSFWDVVSVAKKPFIASHSNARAVCKHPRNLTDEQIKAVKEKGGTIGINFSVKFLDDGWKATNGKGVTFATIKKHIDHISSIAGIETVAMGSDYDGTKIPPCLQTPASYPALFQYLGENGYSKQDLHKIGHENLLRVFKATWT
nr:membrane dipeptidase [Candidatus Sigynarchaeum springense]